MSAALDGVDVSRETLERLTAYVALIEKWTPRINLVSKASLPGIWDRHIRDSAQVFWEAPTARTWVDLGSGGGLPGLVVAILAKEMNPNLSVTLIESDQRKAIFLWTVARDLDLSCNVLTERIERAPVQSADVVSARAVADLSLLLGYADRHLAPDGAALFPKGARWPGELAAAQNDWRFTFDAVPSTTDPRAVILRIHGVSRV